MEGSALPTTGEMHVPVRRSSTSRSNRESDPEKTNEHSKKLKDELVQMYKARALCDVTLKAGDLRVPCHRNILAAGSSYFYAMFNSPMQEAQKFGGEIELKEVDPSVLKILVDFLYTGNITVTEANAQTLMIASDMLCLDDVKGKVGKFYQKNLCVSNCLEFWTLADRLNDGSLADVSLEYAAQHFAEVIQEPEFLELEASGVQKLLRRQNVRASTEEEICMAALKWLDRKPAERAPQMVDVLSGIRLVDLNRNVTRYELMERESLQGQTALMQRLREVQDHQIYNAPVPKWLNLDPPRMHLDTQTCIIIVGGSLIIDNRVGDIRLSFKLERELDGSASVTDYCKLPSKEWGFADVCQFDNTLYVSGVNGSEMWRYEPSIHVWTKCANLLRVREWPQTTFGYSGKFYIMGGFSEELNAGVPEIDEYSTKTNKWREVGKLLHPVYLFGSLFHAGSVYAVGGIIKHDPLSNTATNVCNYIQQFNTVTHVTTMLTTTLPYSSGGLRAAVIRDKFVVFGRKYVYVTESSVLTDVTRKSQMKPKTGLNKSYFGLNIFGDKVVAVGGSIDENTYCDQVMEASIDQLLETSTKDLEWKVTGHLPHKMRIFMTSVLKLKRAEDEPESEN